MFTIVAYDQVRVSFYNMVFTIVFWSYSVIVLQCNLYNDQILPTHSNYVNGYDL
jgi:hypothetical protein